MLQTANCMLRVFQHNFFFKIRVQTERAKSAFRESQRGTPDRPTPSPRHSEKGGRPPPARLVAPVRTPRCRGGLSRGSTSPRPGGLTPRQEGGPGRRASQSEARDAPAQPTGLLGPPGQRGVASVPSALPCGAPGGCVVSASCSPWDGSQRTPEARRAEAAAEGD